MTVCIRCKRPLKQATETGMGPVCARLMRAQAMPEYERDLFGYDIDKAARVAQERFGVYVETLAVTAAMATRASFRAAISRVREGQP